MVPWKKLPKDLRQAILTMLALYGGTTASSCCGPMVCDPPPPPSTTPMPTAKPSMTPLIFDPPPPPSVTRRPTATPSVTPMIFDPPPPPSVTPTPTATPSVTPMICDPQPPPVTLPPTATVALRHFQVRSFQMSSEGGMPGAAVRGTVVDQHGQPLADVKVAVPEGEVELVTLTDHNGAFFLRLHQPGAYLLIVGDDKSHGLRLELKLHDLAIVEWVEIGPQPQSSLPLAEIREVNIVWDGGLNFGAETPWPDAHYRWSTSGGTLVGAGERVTWQPPTEPGRYLLQVVADWGQAGLAVDALTLVVHDNGSVTVC